MRLLLVFLDGALSTRALGHAPSFGRISQMVFATMPTQTIARMSDGPPLAARNIARLLACLLLDWPTSPSISTLHQRLALTECVLLLHGLSRCEPFDNVHGKDSLRGNPTEYSASFPPVLFSRPESEIDTRTREGAPSLHRERYELLANSARAWTCASLRSIGILPMNSAWPAKAAEQFRSESSRDTIGFWLSITRARIARNARMDQPKEQFASHPLPLRHHQHVIGYSTAKRIIVKETKALASEPFASTPVGAIREKYTFTGKFFHCRVAKFKPRLEYVRRQSAGEGTCVCSAQVIARVLCFYDCGIRQTNCLCLSVSVLILCC